MSGPRSRSETRVMIFAIHRSVEWWRCVGKHLGYDKAVVVTDLRGEGDISIVDDFYRALDVQLEQEEPGSELLSHDEAQDVVARCRVLRWLDKRLALAMAHAMAVALDRLLGSLEPQVIVSFPIDRYVKDVLERRAAARGIPYLELTTSVLPGMSMFLRRGNLLKLDTPVDPAIVERKKRELVEPTFAPTYVRVKVDHSRLTFLKTFLYLRTRSLAFKGISLAMRDRLNLHYLDAQSFLGHKARLSDIRIVKKVNHDWQRTLDRFPRERRVFFGLQLFPEASIDYWIDNPEFIQHEECVLEAARAFSANGYLVVIKDHPLQFGVRQVELIDRLLALPNTVFVPYGVSGQTLLQQSGVNFTFTGTLGLQAALAGLKSLVVPCYYSNDQDFIVFRHRRDLAGLAERTESAEFPDSLEERQSRIVGDLMRGSFEGDLFSFKGFSPTRGSDAAVNLARSMGAFMRNFMEQEQ